MEQVLLATIIVLLVVIILQGASRRCEDSDDEDRFSPVNPFARKRPPVTPLPHIDEQRHPVQYRRSTKPPPHSPHWTGRTPSGEGFFDGPMLSVLQERRMGPDGLIDAAFAGQDLNSIYDQFDEHNR